MAYEVILKPSAAKALRSLERDMQRRVVRVLERLADQPRMAGVVKMSGEQNLWRARVGDVRVVYEIHDGRLVVLVLRIGHRRDVYRGTD